MKAHTVEGITEAQVHEFAAEVRKAEPNTTDMRKNKYKIMQKYTATFGPVADLLDVVAETIVLAQDRVNEARLQAWTEGSQALEDQVWRASHGVVRFGDDGRLGINGVAPEYQWNADKKKDEKTSHADWAPRTAPALWVKVVDGWEKDGHWGGHLQVTCRAQNGKWIDSSDGWVKPKSAKGDPVSFYDMGDWYEIWQGDRDNGGKPMVIHDNALRFVKDATPAKFNVQDGS
ncbi:hypothetical protein [Streptomyces vinaceus]|uniref:hypothetical protein n=1 Tax=Streptomyces vinaceus TaxID=1960 RepID=UPI0035DEAA60